MGEPKIKGLAFRSVIEAVSTLRGAEIASRMLDDMDQELASRLRYGSLLASSWYPIRWYRELFGSLMRTTGEGSELARRIGSEAVRNDLNSVHKVMLGLLKPHTVFSVTPRLFKNYYDTGSVSVGESRNGYTQASWRGCEGFDHNLWMEIAGASEAILELSGATHIRFKITGGGQDGDEAMDAEAHWVS